MPFTTFIRSAIVRLITWLDTTANDPHSEIEWLQIRRAYYHTKIAEIDLCLMALRKPL